LSSLSVPTTRLRIGITYDLRAEYLKAGYGEEETAEFDRVETIDAIDVALRQIGHATDRIGNARQLIQRLAQGDRWDLVFNICEGLHGFGREAQVPAILDVYKIPATFADPLVMSVCLHKGITKTLVQAAGLPTPRFAVAEREDDLLAGGWEQATAPGHVAAWRRFPAFAKPVAEGTGKGVTPASRVSTPEELRSVCRELLARYRQPVLVEEFLPGREFTVGILGTGDQAQVLGTFEIVLRSDAEPDVYSYINKERCEELVEYRLVGGVSDSEVRQAEQTALAAWKVLGCRDGGRIDLRSDGQGQPQFLEANPLAGLHPSHSDLPMLATALRMEYRELIRRIVDSSASRIAAYAAANPQPDSHQLQAAWPNP
jgi:D-alanine-D-alanine ligase